MPLLARQCATACVLVTVTLGAMGTVGDGNPIRNPRASQGRPQRADKQTDCESGQQTNCVYRKTIANRRFLNGATWRGVAEHQRLL